MVISREQRHTGSDKKRWKVKEERNGIAQTTNSPSSECLARDKRYRRMDDKHKQQRIVKANSLFPIYKCAIVQMRCVTTIQCASHSDFGDNAFHLGTCVLRYIVHAGSIFIHSQRKRRRKTIPGVDSEWVWFAYRLPNESRPSPVLFSKAPIQISTQHFNRLVRNVDSHSGFSHVVFLVRFLLLLSNAMIPKLYLFNKMCLHIVVNYGRQ